MFVPSFIPRYMFTMDALLASLTSSVNHLATNSGCLSSFRVLTHIVEYYLVDYIAHLTKVQRDQFPWIAVCSNILFTPSIFFEIEPFLPSDPDNNEIIRIALSSNPAATRFVCNHPAWISVDLSEIIARWPCVCLHRACKT